MLHDLMKANLWYKAFLALVFMVSVSIIAVGVLRHGWPAWWDLPLLIIGIPVGVFFSAGTLVVAAFVLGYLSWNGLKAMFMGDRINEAPAQYVLLQHGTDVFVDIAALRLGSDWRVGDPVWLPSNDNEWGDTWYEIVDMQKPGKSYTRVWLKPRE